MSKITLKQPDGPYQAVVDTHVMDVQVRECFTGIQFITVDGEKLSVIMRDSGFEVYYYGEFGGPRTDVGMVEFKAGEIKPHIRGQ